MKLLHVEMPYTIKGSHQLCPPMMLKDTSIFLNHIDLKKPQKRFYIKTILAVEKQFFKEKCLFY